MPIRTACENDYRSVVALYNEFGGDFPTVDGPKGIKKWQEILDHPGTSIFVAEEDDLLVAVVSLHILPNMTFGGRPYALIENVITAKTYRGQGWGKKVMEQAIQKAWDADVYKIMLLSSQKRKDGTARGFYENLGFSADEKFGMTLRRVPARE